MNQTNPASLAIMQPYFFPYLGYFQLLNAVDKFVIYDDVNYIKQGWISRNRILAHGKELMITLPLRESSSFKRIKDIEILRDDKWLEKTKGTLKMAYGKAPYYKEVDDLITSIFNNQISNLSEFLARHLQIIANYLNIDTTLITSSRIYDNQQLKREERLIDICKRENAGHYINALGGQELYSKEIFDAKGIQLNFLKPKLKKYTQSNNEDMFVSGLSIIDVMMNNSPEAILKLLHDYTLV